MIYSAPFDITYLLPHLQKDPGKRCLEAALEHFDNGDFSSGHQMIGNAVESRNPNALILSAIHSKPAESEEDYEARHLQELQLAVEQRHPVALYALAVYFDTGNLVEEDQELANSLFAEAANGHMPPAQYIYGTMLYYGHGKTIKDPNKGLEYLRMAAANGVSEALSVLADIEK